jgi:hypothetical protein
MLFFRMFACTVYPELRGEPRVSTLPAPALSGSLEAPNFSPGLPLPALATTRRCVGAPSPNGDVWPLSSFSGRSLRTSARIAQFYAQIAHQPLCLPHMRKNRGEGGSNLSLFPFCNSTPNLESLSARGYALLVRPFHSFTKECFRTLLQPITSALFLKTAGCVGTEESIQSSLFIRLVLFCLPTAARAQVTTKPIRFCNIQWITDQG